MILWTSYNIFIQIMYRDDFIKNIPESCRGKNTSIRLDIINHHFIFGFTVIPLILSIILIVIFAGHSLYKACKSNENKVVEDRYRQLLEQEDPLCDLIDKLEVDQSQFDGSKKCEICRDTFQETKNDHVIPLPCDHHFHKKCIKVWISDHGSCPLCREIIAFKDMQEIAQRNSSINP